MSVFLLESDKLRSFKRMNMSLKHARIWLNICDSSSSSRSQWLLSYRTTGLFPQFYSTEVWAGGLNPPSHNQYLQTQALVASMMSFSNSLYTTTKHRQTNLNPPPVLLIWRSVVKRGQTGRRPRASKAGGI